MCLKTYLQIQQEIQAMTQARLAKPMQQNRTEQNRTEQKVSKMDNYEFLLLSSFNISLLDDTQYCNSYPHISHDCTQIPFQSYLPQQQQICNTTINW